jgi:hypothetical protein
MRSIAWERDDFLFTATLEHGNVPTRRQLDAHWECATTTVDAGNLAPLYEIASSDSIV